MPFRCRPITYSDKDKWLQMRMQLWPGTNDHFLETEQYFKGQLTEPEAVLFAESETNVIVGFVELSRRKDILSAKGPTGYVEGLYILPEYRGAGATRFLLRCSENWARKNGCSSFASDRADRIILYPNFQ